MMYNRYIPQPDGTHRRSRIPDPPKSMVAPEAHNRPQSSQACEEPQDTCQCEPEHNPPSPPRKSPCTRPRPGRPPCSHPEPCSGKNDGSVGSFFRNLLPGDFDTGDLLIVLLLLLMASDCKEDQNTALLTLALYLFM